MPGQVFEGSMSASDMRIAIVTTRWNEFITDRLTSAAKDTLVRHGANADAIDVAVAPGAYEIPFIVRTLAKTGRYDGVVALGCVIRGATPHFDYVAGEAATGVSAAMRETGIPASFGVLTVDTIEQAIERTGTKAGNKGAEAALALIETIALARAIKETRS
ncbi:MAG: 6,7-dimethyl-8-ribityllumazine synthase [Pseudomonadota bacterium]